VTKRQKYLEDVDLSDEDHLLLPSASDTHDNSLLVKPVSACGIHVISLLQYEVIAN